MERRTHIIYRTPLVRGEEHQYRYDAAPATQRWFIEEALGTRSNTKAQQVLAKWAFQFTEMNRLGQKLPDFDEFQIALDTFLYSSHAKPTDTCTTIRLCDLLEDKDLRARYLYRMIGEPGFDDHRTQPDAYEYWRPAPGELEWLARQRNELSDYPVVEAIDAVTTNTIALQALAYQCASENSVS